MLPTTEKQVEAMLSVRRASLSRGDAADGTKTVEEGRHGTLEGGQGGRERREKK
jgi:hypothetical protein